MILVTGARGHIGNVLVKLLYEKGHTDLRAMIQGGSTDHIERYVKEIVRCDIRDKEAVSEAVRGCSDVFHLAALINLSSRNKQRLHDINVGGVENIVSACLEHGVKRLVHVSSIHALSPSPDRRVDEAIDKNIGHRGDEYGRTKLEGTLKVLAACEEGLDAVVVFPTGVIGPDDYRSSMAGAMFNKYIKARGFQFYFDGQYDFVDVRDVADGTFRAWQQGEKGEGYIITGEPYSIRNIIYQIGQCCGKEFRLLRVPTPLVKLFARMTPLYYALLRKTPVITKETVDVMLSGVKISGEKARNMLGFSPRPVTETIIDTVEWYKEAKKAR